MVIDRANSMMQRDKNHPSILIWSCGNESCGGKIYGRKRRLHGFGGCGFYCDLYDCKRYEKTKKLLLGGK